MLFLEDLTLDFRQTSPPYELVEEEIVSFAERWDPQPFHIDAEAAKASVFGTLTASATHVFCIASRSLHDLQPMAVLAGLSHEIELAGPARAGDRLTIEVTCTDVRESRSRPDRGIVKFESEMKTQDDELVAKLRSTILVAKRPA